MKLLTYLFALFLLPFLFSPTVKSQEAVSTEGVIIMQLQTGGIGENAASQEFVLLYNTSDEDVTISNWCIEYSSGNDNVGFKSCISPPNAGVDLYLQAKGFTSFATNAFIAVNSSFAPDFLFSGGMSPTNGHLRLFNQNDIEQDKVGWGSAINPEGFAATAHGLGFVLSRNFDSLLPDTNNNLVDFNVEPIKEIIISGLYEQEIIIDLCSNIDEVQIEYPDGMLADDNGECFVDFCLNIEGLQIEAPFGYEKKDGSEICTAVPLEDSVLFITEIYPNAPSTDTGQEFIEIYNPNNKTVQLIGYKIQVGPGFTKEYVFKEGEIGQNKYIIFSDSITGIALSNSNGVQLRLVSPADTVVSETTIYSNADEDESWSLVEDQWIFTNQITPGSANKPFLLPVIDEEIGVTSVLSPCPAGKYRNPDTNRCRTIETAVSQLTPCDEDEYRNPDTNRCRKLSTASSSSLTPCKEGEERNPETNRCRKTSVLGATQTGDFSGIEDVQVVSTEGSINIPVIFATLSATIGYILYEWRFELRQRLYLFKKV